MARHWQTRLEHWGTGAVLTVAPLVVWKGVSDMALLPPYLAWVASLSLLLASRLRKQSDPVNGEGFPRLPGFFWPLLVFVGWAGLSCFWARNPWEGVFEWSKILLLLVWVVLLLQIRSREELFSKLVPRCVSLMAAIALGFGFIQLVQAGLENGGLGHITTYQVVSFFAHRNLFAETLLLSLPLVGSMWLRDRGLWRWLGGGLAFLIVLMLVVLQVRSTWLGLGCEALVGLAGLGLAVRKSADGRPMIRKALLLIVLALAAGGIGFLVYRSLPGASNLLLVGKSISATHYGSTQERLVLWEKTLHLIQDRPLSGYGLGGWRVELPRLGYDRMRMDMQVGKAMFVRAHNDYLQITAETGLIGGLLWLGTLFIGIGRAVRGWFLPAAGGQRAMAVVAAMGLCAYAVVAFFSFPMERVSSLILVGLYLCLPAPDGSKPRLNWLPNPKKWQRPLVWATFGLLIAAAMLGLARVSTDRHLLKALAYRSQGNFKAMGEELRAGDNGLSRLDPTAAPYKWYAGSAKFQLGDLKGALGDFQAAYRANPYHLHVLNNLGAAWVQNGQLDSGMVYFRKALELSPVFSEARVNLATTCFNLGQIDLATQEMLALPDSLEDPVIPLLAQGIVKAHVATLVPDIEEHALQLKLVAISNSPAWCLDLLHKAAEKDRPIANQLLLEAIYALEIQDKVINLHQAAMWRAKYDSIH